MWYLSPHSPSNLEETPAMALFRRKPTMPAAAAALPGRTTPLRVPETHFVNGHRIVPPFPAGMREAIFGLGCFWGAEDRKSTRLNSSHMSISYAVFCLKKKKIINRRLLVATLFSIKLISLINYSTYTQHIDYLNL